MRIRLSGLFAAVALASVLSSGAAHAETPHLPPLQIEKYALDNGLEVILHEDHRTPVVAVNIWYHVGSKDEPKDRNGFAHLFEHLMFQGSKHVAEDTFFKYLERAGASERNGTTNLDRTNYFETVPSNQLAMALWLEGDRMGTLLEHANDETFKSQREVVKNERRQNYENAPYGLVRQFIRAAVFPEGHPYHLLTIGTPEDLDAATMDDVKAFFRTFYVPNNATLVVAGDLDVAKTKELVTRYFGWIPKAAAPPVHTTPVPSVLTSEKTLDVEADVELPRLTITWPSAPEFAKGDAELDLLSRVLASGKSSVLYKRLVYEMQIAQSVSASQDSGQLASTFDITVTLRKGKDPKAALKVVDEILADLQRSAPSEDQMARARVGIETGLMFGMERITAKADSMNEFNQLAKTPDYFEQNIARYTSVRAEDVELAAASLPKTGRVVAIVTPTKDAPRAGRLAQPAVTAKAGAK
jgi:predicted Zn-dependent peptidase